MDSRILQIYNGHKLETIVPMFYYVAE